MHENPSFDIGTISTVSYPAEFEASHRKYRNLAATDDPNLDNAAGQVGVEAGASGHAAPQELAVRVSRTVPDPVDGVRLHGRQAGGRIQGLPVH